MTRLYRFKTRMGAAHAATVAICDECINSRELVNENKGNPKFPGRGGQPLNSRLEKVSDEAKGEECTHQWRASGPIGPGWNDRPAEGKAN